MNIRKHDTLINNNVALSTAISLFTGYGGIDLALKRVEPGIRTLCYVEIEAFAVANLVAKIQAGLLDDAPIWSDIKTFDCSPWIGQVDLIHGGYPCQGFSAAGNRKGEEDPRYLWPWVRRAVSIIRPKRVFFENVEGHITLGLREVLTDLASLGYRVENSRKEPTFGLFSAAEVGAPHQRKRVFILGEWRDMDHTNARHEFTQRQIPAGRDSASDTGELADAGLRNRRTKQRIKQRIKQETQSEELCGIDGSDVAEPGQPSGQGLAFTSGAGQQRAERFEPFRDEGKTAQGSVGECGCVERQSEPASLDQVPGLRRMVVHASRDAHSGVPMSADRRMDNRSIQRWPARPGEPQHDWEATRTTRPVEFGVGQSTDGTSGRMGGRGSNTRVDQLRLLGNGCVPATVAKAWIVLNQRLCDTSKKK